MITVPEGFSLQYSEHSQGIALLRHNASGYGSCLTSLRKGDSITQKQLDGTAGWMLQRAITSAKSDMTVGD